MISAIYQNVRLIYRNLLHFYTPIMKHQRGIIIVKIASKKEDTKHRNILNHGGERLIHWTQQNVDKELEDYSKK